MTKKKKLAKEALRHPELFSKAELAYFQKWLEEKKRIKDILKNTANSDFLSRFTKKDH